MFLFERKHEIEKKKSNTFLFEETLDFKKELYIHKGNFINHLRSIMHKSCDYHMNILIIKRERRT